MKSRLLNRLAKWPFLAVPSLTEMLLSRRGFALGFLLVAALLTRGAWVRPPLSPDIRAMQLPLALRPLPEGVAERMLVGPHMAGGKIAPREYYLDSVGTILLVIIEIGV